MNLTKFSPDEEKLTREHYEKEAKRYYLENVTPGTLTYYEYNVMKKLLFKLLRRSTCDLKLLDIGCGTGVYTKFLADNGFSSIIGVDFSIEMLAEARMKQLPFLMACSATSLPLQSESVDLVTSFALMEHLPNPLLVVNEMFRVLKKGGSLICMTPNPVSLALFMNTLRGRIQKCEQFENFLFPGEFKGLFRRFIEPDYYSVYILPPPPILWPTLEILRRFAKKLVHPYLITLMKFEHLILQRLPLVKKLGYLQVICVKKEMESKTRLRLLSRQQIGASDLQSCNSVL